MRRILKDTMGAEHAYAMRCRELGSEDKALESFVREACRGGRLFEYLTVGRLAVQLDDVLFVHGGLPRAGEQWAPGWLPPKGQRLGLKAWLQGLERFKMEQLQQILDGHGHGGHPKTSWSMLGGYDHPQPGAGLLQRLGARGKIFHVDGLEK